MLASPRPAVAAVEEQQPDGDDIDEIAALMALGMYDTAVVKHEEAPNAADAQFGDMVEQVAWSSRVERWRPAHSPAARSSAATARSA